MDLYLCKEGVQSLREFAEVMPIAVSNIGQSTEKLFQIYQSCEEGLGVHNKDFYEILRITAMAIKNCEEAVNALSPKLNSTADSIEDYLSGNGSDGIKVKTLKRG